MAALVGADAWRERMRHTPWFDPVLLEGNRRQSGRRLRGSAAQVISERPSGPQTRSTYGLFGIDLLTP